MDSITLRYWHGRPTLLSGSSFFLEIISMKWILPEIETIPFQSRDLLSPEEGEYEAFCDMFLDEGKEFSGLMEDEE